MPSTNPLESGLGVKVGTGIAGELCCLLGTRGMRRLLLLLLLLVLLRVLGLADRRRFRDAAVAGTSLLLAVKGKGCVAVAVVVEVMAKGDDKDGPVCLRMLGRPSLLSLLVRPGCTILLRGRGGVAPRVLLLRPASACLPMLLLRRRSKAEAGIAAGSSSFLSRERLLLVGVGVLPMLVLLVVLLLLLDTTVRRVLGLKDMAVFLPLLLWWLLLVREDNDNGDSADGRR